MFTRVVPVSCIPVGHSFSGIGDEEMYLRGHSMDLYLSICLLDLHPIHLLNRIKFGTHRLCDY